MESLANILRIILSFSKENFHLTNADYFCKVNELKMSAAAVLEELKNLAAENCDLLMERNQAIKELAQEKEEKAVLRKSLLNSLCCECFSHSSIQKTVPLHQAAEMPQKTDDITELQHNVINETTPKPNSIGKENMKYTVRPSQPLNILNQISGNMSDAMQLMNSLSVEMRRVNDYVQNLCSLKNSSTQSSSLNHSSLCGMDKNETKSQRCENVELKVLSRQVIGTLKIMGTVSEIMMMINQWILGEPTNIDRSKNERGVDLNGTSGPQDKRICLPVSPMVSGFVIQKPTVSLQRISYPKNIPSTLGGQFLTLSPVQEEEEDVTNRQRRSMGRRNRVAAADEGTEELLLPVVRLSMLRGNSWILPTVRKL